MGEIVRFVVGKAEEIPPGSRKIVRVAGRSIGVFNVAGEYYAIRNRCPHQGAPLCEGKLWGALKSDVPGSFEYNPVKDILACIQHGWEFSVRTGQSWCDPKRLRVRAYQVAVEDPEAPAPGMVKGPYAVETFPVTVEGGYLYLVVDVVDVAASPPSRTELRVSS